MTGEYSVMVELLTNMQEFKKSIFIYAQDKNNN